MADIEQRARFEAWAESEGLIGVSHGIMSVNSQAETAWRAWQAALASQGEQLALSQDGITALPGERVSMTWAQYAALAARQPVVYACPECGTGMEVDPTAKPAQPQAPAAAVPERWRAFVESCADMRGLTVDGNRLALKARELLAAAPAPEVTECTGPNCTGHPHSEECRAEYARCLNGQEKNDEQ